MAMLRTQWLSKVLSWTACLLLLVSAVPMSAAEDADVKERIAAHLDAGEFAVAKQLIGGIVNGPQRDAALAQMAMAQAGAGNRRGFGNALRGIGNGQVRSGSLAQGNSNGGFAGGQSGFGLPPGAAGGGAMADFTELIELITTTTGKPKPGWADDGGVGTISESYNGVYFDASGALKRIVADGSSVNLENARKSAQATNGNRNVRLRSPLRKISLTRLERELQVLRAQGRNTDDVMAHLAGLEKIQYVLVYPESGDIVLAGPAGAWSKDIEGRDVSVDSGRPVLHLDDLIVLLRRAADGNKPFGCSINPREANLANTKEFLEESNKQPLKQGQRPAWLAKLRDTVGKQDIVVFGIDPQTHVAQVMVEADYRMKLVGMGLEEGVSGVVSYLDSIEVAANQAPPPVDVLRWWFAVNYDAIQATKSNDAFELKGQGVKVLSENQMLNERGQRTATGKSDELNARFAQSFTKHFAELSTKYPVYAELQNIFDLALVAALIQAQDLSGQAHWHQSFVANPDFYPVRRGVAPKEVDSVINHRVVNRKHIVAGVSGGVNVDVSKLVQPGAIKIDTYGKLDADHRSSVPKQLANDAWWWD